MLLAAAITLALTVPPQNEVLLRYKFHPGQVTKYAVDVSIKMTNSEDGVVSPTNFDSKTVETQTVKIVEAFGTAIAQVRDDVVVSKTNVKPTPGFASNKTTKSMITMGPLGSVKEGTGAEKSGVAFGAAQQDNFLPVKPVHVGSRFDSNFTYGAVGTLLTHYRVDRVEKSGRNVLAYLTGTGSVEIKNLASRVEPEVKSYGNGRFLVHVKGVINVTQGIGQSYEMNGVMNLNMTITGSRKGVRPMKVKIAQISNIRMTLLSNR